MKNMPLYKLRKKSNKYFKNLGVVTTKGRTKKQIRYIVERAYEVLPKKYKKYEDDAETLINTLYNTILADGEFSQLDPYQAFFSHAERNYRKQHVGTLEDVWKMFREQYTSLYNKYNTYVYRLGWSAKNLFFENAETTLNRNWVIVDVQLPFKATGIVYTMLHIEYDYSNKTIYAVMY